MYSTPWGSSAELGELCQHGETHGWHAGGNVIFGERRGCSVAVTDSVDYLCSIQSRRAAGND